MQTEAVAGLPSPATLANWEKREPNIATYPPLEAVTRPAVDTEAAAYYLNRRPQTLRSWACFDSGPIKPSRINGRLAWPVAELRRLCGV
ncbi:MAG: hypothetical protein V4864_16110 [Pseudomonadota bacterium]